MAKNPLIKRYLDAGMAFTQMTQSRAEAIVKDLVKQGEGIAYVGDTEVWEVLNDTDYAHPFHLHGFSFEVLEVGGRPWPVREMKDADARAAS